MAADHTFTMVFTNGMVIHFPAVPPSCPAFATVMIDWLFARGIHPANGFVIEQTIHMIPAGMVVVGGRDAAGAHVIDHLNVQ